MLKSFITTVHEATRITPKGVHKQMHQNRTEHFMSNVYSALEVLRLVNKVLAEYNKAFLDFIKPVHLKHFIDIYFRVHFADCSRALQRIFGCSLAASFTPYLLNSFAAYLKTFLVAPQSTTKLQSLCLRLMWHFPPPLKLRNCQWFLPVTADLL